jgi:hypothetical protein
MRLVTTQTIVLLTIFYARVRTHTTWLDGGLAVQVGDIDSYNI